MFEGPVSSSHDWWQVMHWFSVLWAAALIGRAAAQANAISFSSVFMAASYFTR
jgi:hypothetical protein